jgi:hypothetical protein
VWGSGSPAVKGFGFECGQSRRRRAGRERMGSPTLPALQEPILRLPWTPTWEGRAM